jgi:hypothetical protein
MTYVSRESGRQFVVVAVGNDIQNKPDANYLMAFALPPDSAK